MTTEEDRREIGYKIFVDTFERIRHEIAEEHWASTMLTLSASLLSAVLDAMGAPPEQAITIPQRAIDGVVDAGLRARDAAEIELAREKMVAH